tara:strand:- start:494 stop:751 length:258 start_codon:yes stop_codon:yes gene_type:complete
MKEEEKYYKKKGLTLLGCWMRNECEWCGKRIQGNGTDAGGFECSDPKCESRKDKPEPFTDREQADLILCIVIGFFLCIMVGLLLK